MTFVVAVLEVSVGSFGAASGSDPPLLPVGWVQRYVGFDLERAQTNM